jgi:hypothetical protein
MIITGMIAVIMIVFSVWLPPAETPGEKIEDGQKTEIPVIKPTVGTEAVTASAIQLDRFIPASLLEKKLPLRVAVITVTYFQTLFRTVISPNAP